ncbi:hypothetical protein A2U01_0064851, partial [Trifolium medium]|nr:hypothetical protein [Trifolium medium]
WEGGGADGVGGGGERWRWGEEGWSAKEEECENIYHCVEIRRGNL